MTAIEEAFWGIVKSHGGIGGIPNIEKNTNP